MNTKKNIVEIFLEFSKIRFTREYVRKLFDENPYKHTMFGISTVLSEYSVAAKGLRLKNKEDIYLLGKPFIATVGQQYFLVPEIKKKDKVECIGINGKQWYDSGHFFKQWNGIALTMETSEKSIEPEYHENRKKEFFNMVRNSLLIYTVFAFILLTFKGFTDGFYTVCAIILNFIGIYIGFLLLQKQINIYNMQADKICSLIKKGNCDNVLDSPAAKFMGIIGWSEVGFSYFISNLCVMLFFLH